MATTPPSPTGAADETGEHLRGSTLLLSGRVLSLVINLVVQVLIARHLSERDYGAFAYALSLVVLAETVSNLGLHRSIGRFLAVYDEQRDDARLLGTLVVVLSTIGGIGLSLVVVVVAAQSWLAGTLVDDRTAAVLLAVLIVLAPVQALDNVLSGVLAVFGSARAIFVRQHLLGPGLRLVVVLLLVGADRGVRFLAVGYAVTGAAGLLLYAGVLWRVLGRRGLGATWRRRELTFPVREILAFTLPLLSTDLVYLCVNSVDAILVGHFHGTEAVADLRVIQPLANLNVLVFTSFTLLYLPIASRLMAREDRAGVRDLYWRTAAWIAVLTFPIFATTVSLAEPVTAALFGERYAESGQYLMITSLGLYFTSALGFNGLTLRVFGFLRYTLLINLVAVVVNLALGLLLVPDHGALGAAIATAGTLVVHNVLKQIGLVRGTGVGLLDRRYLRVYGWIVGLLLALVTVHVVLEPGLLVGLALTAMATVVLLLQTRQLLDVAGTFPAVARLPLVGRLLTRP